MEDHLPIIAVIGPTASGKSARAIALAKDHDGEVISVDSRQVYRTLDIGTEKLSTEEMQGVPHHLMDIREPEDTYSAGDFVSDADRLIAELHARGKTPILAGGTHFYFDALLYGLPQMPSDPAVRAKLETLSDEALFARIAELDPRRARMLDPHNRRRLVRALEIITLHGSVPERERSEPRYRVEWIVIDPPKEELQARIDARLQQALHRGLIGEVRRTRERVGDARLNELGLEYRIVGEFLRGERTEESLLGALSVKLWHYAREQKKWLRALARYSNPTKEA
ncbi:MAG TPA: tRNA (adenosine(37)-N6)-dimethylallyltransferase MiaA [Candidatus Paceibacterota bacterium]|jgi:tRNA dimethylallyltransferase|nr:tRNA (adenosine(37)-N6)-dimethylallyltransferase MiaA [Candidatus Paceibacterota bacterium]